VADPNPWLTIPAADYLGHMGSPVVDQLSVLSTILEVALDQHRPRSLLVIGCATGNGFEHIDPAVTRKVTAVDLNPEYLDHLRRRFPDPAFELTLRCQDAAGCEYADAAFDLVHAGLVLEYLDWRVLLPRLARTLRPGGVLSLVLQLPSPTVPAVTPSPFPSLCRLETLFRFVDPGKLIPLARAQGHALGDSRACLRARGSGSSRSSFREGRRPLARQVSEAQAQAADTAPEVELLLP